MHFNFTLIRLNNKSSPQFIRLKWHKVSAEQSNCSLNTSDSLWILEGQEKPFFCRSATRTFLRICRVIIYRNVEMLLKPSLSWLARAGTRGMSVTQLTRITICPRHRLLLGRFYRAPKSCQVGYKFGGKTCHKLPNAKPPSKYVFFLVKLLYCCCRIA